MAVPKDRGAYNRMWPTRFVVTCWTLELLYTVGVLAWICTSLGLGAVSLLVFNNDTGSLRTAFLLAASFSIILLVSSIAFDIAAIVLFSKHTLQPACYLSFQCVRLAALVAMALVWWQFPNPGITQILFTVTLPLAVTQLAYGAVVVHRYRQGFYARVVETKADHRPLPTYERDLEEGKESSASILERIPSASPSLDEVQKPKKNRGAYNRMWPKRFVITFWTLDLLCFTAICFCSTWYAVTLSTQQTPSKDITTTITMSINAACCITAIGLDIANIVSFARSNLRATVYLLYQSIKAMLFFLVVIIGAVSSFAAADALLALALAASPFLLSVGQLIYGAVALQREKEGFYLPKETAHSVTVNEEGMPQLHHVCVACGLYRPVSVYAYRGDDGTILTPAFSSRYGDSVTLRSGPVWSGIGSDAAPPYSWKGSLTGPPSIMSSGLVEARSVRSAGGDLDSMSVDIAEAGVTEGPRTDESIS